LFAAWTLLTRPGLFENRVVVSPSVWYDDQLLLRLARSPSPAPRDHSGRVYLCAGSRENERMPREMERLAALLEGEAYDGLEVAHLVMEGETHNSIFPGCLSNGLRFVLEGV
jgi:predicted alpha/beta superfamily hydrolase